MSGTSLRARGIAKSFVDGPRRVEVLRGVDLDVEAGAMLAIVGPSGSGKSTLLQILGTLEHPDSGNVRIGEVDLREIHGDELAAFRNRTIGFVFQFHQLLPDFTALENVMMPARIAGTAAAPAAARAAALLDEAGLAERRDHFPSQLSGGEQQRVAICRAIVMEPAVLLADEPTGNLDPETGERVLGALFELQARRRMTTILVTHNPAVATRCASILRLEGGILGPLETA